MGATVKTYRVPPGFAFGAPPRIAFVFAICLAPLNAFAESDGTTGALGQVLISWVPMLILIGAWIYAMNRLRSGPQVEHMKRYADAMERCDVSLKKIAETLERIAGK